MKRSRFADCQVLSILKQAEDGVAAAELCRQYGISVATFYKWRSKYGGLDVSIMSRLKKIELQKNRCTPASKSAPTHNCY